MGWGRLSKILKIFSKYVEIERRGFAYKLFKGCCDRITIFVDLPFIAQNTFRGWSKGSEGGCFRINLLSFRNYMYWDPIQNKIPSKMLWKSHYLYILCPPNTHTHTHTHKNSAVLWYVQYFFFYLFQTCNIITRKRKPSKNKPIVNATLLTCGNILKD